MLKRYLRKIKHFILPPLSFLEREQLQLKKLPTAQLSVDVLAPLDAFDKKLAFENHTEIWTKASAEIRPLMAAEELSEGVNPGDRRAIHALIYYLQAHTVLEVGTNVGASTLHIAQALRQMQQENKQDHYHLTTVDIVDVNALQGPWQQQGLPQSPRSMIQKLGFEEHVSFVAQDALIFLKNTQQTFDFIFLDGNHAAAVVYQEMAAALRVLNPEGYLLLHDYFPNLEPLWADGPIIPGPWLGVQRLQQENPHLAVLPLGMLPWQTKLNSNVTNLALVGRAR
jgi:predicted O-methyltransferase YrrM